MVIVGVGTLVGFAGLAAVATVGALSEDLPDPAELHSLTFSQPTVVYDRTGKIELARFQRERRRVVTYDQVPRLVLDVTTTAEDRSFWNNDGFDPGAIVAAIAQNASSDGQVRGASTITQQLVRARLLPDEVVAPGSDRYIRKAKELIQAARLTAAFPGEEGKQQIVTAYLNEIYYGHEAYGIAAAATIYFGVSDLADLTPAQAALLAGLPKSPSALDPYQFAKRDRRGRLVVPQDAPPVVRRNWILEHLSTSRSTRLSQDELDAALAEPVILSGVEPLKYRAAHFSWQVRRQLEQILGDRQAVETGGYQVITTLDWRAQRLAEKWLTASVIAPNLRSWGAMSRLLRDVGIRDVDRGWVEALRGKDLHNGALVALDYRRGDVLAYAGSAGYYRDGMASRRFNPKYDAAGDGVRQPGSAFKPIVYSTAFDRRALTAGSLLLDITTEFGEDWAPRDADQLERGPVLVRRAVQYSLNIPAIRALERVGSEAVATTARQMGIRFAGGRKAFLQAGLAGAIGTVEVRPLDLTAAFGTIANRGRYVAPRMILEVRAPDGSVVWRAPDPNPQRAISRQAAFVMTDILAGNTDPDQNPIWAEALQLTNGPGGRVRPAAVKTGTANEARDLATYGYLPAPKGNRPAVAIGVWMGNSDHSTPRSEDPAISLTAAAPLWRSFVRDYTKAWPVSRFHRPKGLMQTTIDAWSGGQPGPWTRDLTEEWFIAGTQPGGPKEVDEAGLLYEPGCGTWVVDPRAAELGPETWLDDVEGWLFRARSGPGVTGRHESRTAYFWGESSWGGPLAGPCAPPKDDKDDDKKPGDDKPRKPGKPPKPPKPPGPDDAGSLVTEVAVPDETVVRSTSPTLVRWD
jgi:membrane peptidoglycan carboxypeptidase